MYSLKTILPPAIRWAEEQSQIAIRAGNPLNVWQSQVAEKVGVRCWDRVRVCEVDAIPLPTSPALQKAAHQLGILGHGVIAITLGYGVMLTRNYLTPEVIAHELRHVAQFEQAGSLAGFLGEYLQQISQVGYRKAPFEIDARNFEFHGNLIDCAEKDRGSKESDAVEHVAVQTGCTE